MKKGECPTKKSRRENVQRIQESLLEFKKQKKEGRKVFPSYDTSLWSHRKMEADRGALKGTSGIRLGFCTQYWQDWQFKRKHPVKLEEGWLDGLACADPCCIRPAISLISGTHEGGRRKLALQSYPLTYVPWPVGLHTHNMCTNTHIHHTHTHC